VAKRLAQDGFTVVVNYLSNAAEAEEVVAELKGKGSGPQLSLTLQSLRPWAITSGLPVTRQAEILQSVLHDFATSEK
jgi:NAD(P)-dependent dehydrogenase (short-subunit alcohol dehydrogenase family)